MKINVAKLSIFSRPTTGRISSLYGKREEVYYHHCYYYCYYFPHFSQLKYLWKKCIKKTAKEIEETHIYCETTIISHEKKNSLGKS
jgi:hypothetical protein